MSQKQDQKVSNILTKQHHDDEEIISAGLKAFFEVGSALMRIRDSKSYKEVDLYKTFDEYCRDKWDMGKNYANEYISSAKVLENLTGIPVIPSNVSQCRPIISLNPKLQRKIWQAVVDASLDSGKKITAKLVQEFVDEICAPDPKIAEEIRREQAERMDCPDDTEGFSSHQEHKFDSEYERTKKDWKKDADAARDSFNNLLKFLDKMGLSDATMNEFCRNFDPASKGLFHEFILAGYREMSKKHHPDKGGSSDRMIQINKINKFFKGYVDNVFS
jgi:hypothetical protein